tara:strand:+ start:528 stop:1340 length:813 start_codon:yes stop_codon:yes gene_type:complete
MKKVIVNDVCFGGDSLGLILGPCVIESRDHSLMMADSICQITNRIGFKVIFKSSIDKANRSSINSFRGLGFDEGLSILEEVKKEIGCPIITDIHEPLQAELVSEVVDVIQIPAFLCRQTDLLITAAKTGKPVNIKKGQFLAPWDMKNVITKLKGSQCEKIILTDRGTQFGYNNLVADMRSIPLMQDFGFPVVFDATHSAQLPGGNGLTSSGMREMIPTLAKSAVAAGCNGIFMEVHNNVNNAKSDAATQWPLSELEPLLLSLKNIRDALI